MPLAKNQRGLKRKMCAGRLHRGSSERRERVRAENARCCDLERLLARTRTDPERPGCLIWTGRVQAVYGGSIKPVVFAGLLGSMLADRAMWLALGRAGLVGKNYLRTSCGHFDCIAGEHLYLTNQTQERARKALGSAP